MSRRFVSLVMLLGLALLCPGCILSDLFCPAQVESNHVSLLFSQYATGGALVQSGTSGRYTLMLDEVAGQVACFVESPERASGFVSIVDYIEQWEILHAGETASAVLIYLEEEAPAHPLALHLSNPLYDSEDDVMTFTATLMESQTPPADFGRVCLKVDTTTMLKARSAVDVLTNDELAQTIADLKATLEAFSSSD